ncbi:MAG: tetratricopeptide repeat protein [Deltaproteobacteria bacterium]|nr:tetratricopeptide repeat protein [Deltaproteobacteria bacterium]
MTITKTLRVWRLAVFAVISLGLTACSSPTPKPKTAADVQQSGGGAAALVKAKPQRKLSGEAKSDFMAVVKKYESAKKSGLKGGACADLASEFGDVYAAHNLPEAKFNQGVLLEQCGNRKEAAQVYSSLLAKHPKFAPAINNLGELKVLSGEGGAALDLFQEAVRLKSSEGYTNLAMLQRGRALAGERAVLVDAVNNIHRSLAVDSSNIDAYNLKAVLVYDHAQGSSKLEMARLLAVQAAKQQPSYAPIYNVLGLVLLKQGKVTPALQQFRKAVERDPNFIDALMNIGAITLSFRDYKTAENSFERVLKLGAPSKEIEHAATVGLGVALRGQRKYQEALAKYQAAEKLKPSDTSLAYNIGVLYQDYLFDAGTPEKGISTLKTALGHLQRYLAGNTRLVRKKDAERRAKNIREMIPMLVEQQKMMEDMRKMQEKQKAQDAAANKKKS